MLLHEVAALHNVIESLDLERRIKKSRSVRRIKRDPMMQPVDPQIGDVAHPIAHLGTEDFPEAQVSGQIFRSQTDTVKFEDSGIPAGKIRRPLCVGRDTKSIKLPEASRVSSAACTSRFWLSCAVARRPEKPVADNRSAS